MYIADIKIGKYFGFFLVSGETIFCFSFIPEKSRCREFYRSKSLNCTGFRSGGLGKRSNKTGTR
jgi:hypothetical protein